MEWLLIAAGGALGAVSRFAVVRAASSMAGGFPLGTLLVNVIGCLLAGFFVQWISVRAPYSELRPMIQVGFFGAFTTFSAFSMDTFQLWQEQAYAVASLNIALNVALSLGAMVVGVLAARTLL